MVASRSAMPPVTLSPSKISGDSAPPEHQTPRGPTRNELWRWCLRADAVAQCYIRDVMQLKEPDKGQSNDQDMFWWLGTVPCRSVKFVGMLVEAIAYEKRTMYTVDDGTGVISCVHLHPSSAQDKQKSKQQAATAPVPDSPKPRYDIGDILGVTGRVQTWRDSRQVLVNEIELCKPNDEPQHWITTAKLHESYYSQPFLIPPLPPPAIPKTPVKSTHIASAFATPNTASTVPTPSTTASTASACTAGEGHPARLRHPSRLRSKELIANTFKIYLKNYMDVLSDPRPFHEPSPHFHYCASSSVEESPTKRLKCRHDANVATPKPRGRLRSLSGFDETPRASDRYRQEKSRQTTARQPKGFTFSYLRRVPELADMALRVVQAEGKRRARDARQKQKEATRTGKTAKPPEPSLAEPPNRKAKRLYTWALRELHKEGAIILHDDDAPVWEWSVAVTSTRDIWKASKSDPGTLTADNTDVTASTTALNLTRITTAHNNESLLDPGELSDPPLHEESYVPLMPAMLTEPIVEAIKCMLMRKPAPKPREATTNYRGHGSHAIGPTTEELREYIGQVDARWENVGEYAIADALALLKADDRVYKVGNGRWELSI